LEMSFSYEARSVIMRERKQRLGGGPEVPAWVAQWLKREYTYIARLEGEEPSFPNWLTRFATYNIHATHANLARLSKLQQQGNGTGKRVEGKHTSYRRRGPRS